jgi:hypothetical protein
MVLTRLAFDVRNRIGAFAERPRRSPPDLLDVESNIDLASTVHRVLKVVVVYVEWVDAKLNLVAKVLEQRVRSVKRSNAARRPGGARSIQEG